MSGRQRSAVARRACVRVKDCLSLPENSSTTDGEDNIESGVPSASAHSSNLTGHSDTALLEALDGVRSSVDEVYSMMDIDDNIDRPRLLCTNKNARLASKDTESLIPQEYSIIERAFLKMDSFLADEEVMETIQQFIWDRQNTGNKFNIGGEKLLAMLAHAAACRLSELVPPAELPLSSQRYLDEHLTIEALPLVDPTLSSWLCVERVKFVLELISMSSSDFKDHELKLMLFAIIKIGSDELSDCAVLREISKTLNNLFSYLSDERKNAVFVDLCKSFKFFADTMDHFYYAFQVMTGCTALSACKLLCLERLLISLTHRTDMEPINDDVISRGQHFKTIVLLLCEYTGKAMGSERHEIYVFLNILLEVLGYDNVIDAETEDLTKMYFELLEWKRSLMKGSAATAAILVEQILSIVNRIEMWRPSIESLNIPMVGRDRVGLDGKHLLATVKPQ